MSQHRSYAGVLSVVGVVLLGYGVAITLCAGLGFAFDYVETADLSRFRSTFDLLAAAGSTALVGLVLLLPARSRQRAPPGPAPRFSPRASRGRGDIVTRREATLAVASIWVATSLAGAAPFWIGAGMSFPDGLFESVSGLTTTGATVITDIEGRISHPLLLWRSLTQWLGGMGIVVFFVAVFPNLRGGGKHMFGEEVPGTSSEGLRPRIKETSSILWRMYLTFTVLTGLGLWLCGMTVFDSICHAMTAMSTGGFSTRDASIGGFDNAAIEILLTFVMVFASVNYGLYYAAYRAVFRPRRTPGVAVGARVGRAIRDGLRTFARSPELMTFLILVLAAFSALAAGHLLAQGADPLTAARRAGFMVATTISSTGYGTHDYGVYPSAMLGVMLFLMFVGGCAGSTAGGIKVERVVIMAKITFAELRSSYRPSLVQIVRMGTKPVSDGVVTDTLVFFVLFMAALGTGVVSVCVLEGVPVPTAFGAVLSCLSNMGPAPFHLDADNFAAYGGFTKVLFAFLMLFGRLEFFALLAVLSPGFWRS